MSNREPSCFERVSLVFERLAGTAKGQTALKRFDQIVQFDLRDFQPFRVEIKEGRVLLTKGIVEGLPLEQSLFIKTDEDTLKSMLEKKFSLADAIYDRKLWVYGNVLKGPAMAWLSQLLQLRA